ncbi:MAG TPA: SPOR domain-containing protein [Burkholderiales bacterium]|nr:SPOR domain-containing protein [Burkholderiales bacterium]
MLEQPAFKKNNSNIIKLSEKTKKQAIRRLIGSIFLLLLALILLLNVTTKTKRVSITPQTIEIKHNSSTNTLSTAKILAESTNIINKDLIQPPTVSKIEKQNTNPKIANPVIKVESLNLTQTKNAVSKDKNSLNTIHGQIVVEKDKAKPNPEDILNNINPSTTSKYYIQLAALNDKKKLVHLQQELAHKNIKTFIEPANNNKNVYRLRIGPFKTKENAFKKLEEIKNISLSTNF